MVTRLLFALIGSLTGLLAAALGGWILETTRLAPALEEGTAPVLLFTSETARRLEREGAKTGDIQITLTWNNRNDLDLHVVDPSRERIFYQHRRSRSSGELDVDMNVQAPLSTRPVENVYWPRGRAPNGRYRIYVHHYRNHGDENPTRYQVIARLGGETRQFTGSVTARRPPRLIATIDYRAGWAAPWWLEGPFWRAVLAVSLWGALLGLGLAVLLALPQRWFSPVSAVRRAGMSRRPSAFASTLEAFRRMTGQSKEEARSAHPVIRDAIPVLIGGAKQALKGLLVGGMAGGMAQFLFGGISGLFPGVPSAPLRVAGFILLGGFLGRTLGVFVPRLPRRAAMISGATGGAVGAMLFLAAIDAAADPVGRWRSAVSIGFFIGLMIRLAREPIDEPAPAEEVAIARTPARLRTGVPARLYRYHSREDIPTRKRQ